jgi:hypothetical protein
VAKAFKFVGARFGHVAHAFTGIDAGRSIISSRASWLWRQAKAVGDDPVDHALGHDGFHVKIPLRTIVGM